MIQKRVGTGNINNYTGQSTAGNNNIKNISNRFEYRWEVWQMGILPAGITIC